MSWQVFYVLTFIEEVRIMRDVLDLNSLSLIEVFIDGKLVVSEFIEPENQPKTNPALQRLKAVLIDSNIDSVMTNVCHSNSVKG